jgi:hypothetical protein
MSKKSRKRNKKILAAIGLGLGAMALSKRKNKADLASTEDGKGGIDTIAKAKQSMTSDKAYSPPKKKSTPKVYQDDIMKGGSGTKYVDKYAGTPLRRLQNSPLRTDGLGDMDMKDGGRAGYKSGGSTGSSKSSGCAIKGISPILMKGRK